MLPGTFLAAVAHAPRLIERRSKFILVRSKFVYSYLWLSPKILSLEKVKIYLAFSSLIRTFGCRRKYFHSEMKINCNLFCISFVYSYLCTHYEDFYCYSDTRARQIYY